MKFSAKTSRRLVAGLLAASGFLLATMIPGGPVETRDFSAISPLTLAAFNVFLTLLGMGSVALAYIIGARRRSWFVLSSVVGVAYAAVYGLDLFGIFPRSPIAMPRLLWILEWIGGLVAIPLTAVSMASATPRKDDSDNDATGFYVPPIVVVALAIAALVIVAHATRAALVSR